MRLVSLASVIVATFTWMSEGWAGEPQPDEPLRGTVSFLPTDMEARVPERFRLSAHEFSWTERPRPAVSNRIAISDVTFPSPVVTPFVENNTVHAEYYRPQVAGKVPGVVVLHILGGDFPLARIFSNGLAQRGVAALFVKMPYYGPRRPAQGRRRMVSSDPLETVEGMTQAVLDIRHAVAWLGARPEIDGSRLGVFGISLGGITAALAISVEPRLQNGCFILAGGGMGELAWESKELEYARSEWLAQGRRKEEFFELLKCIDPVTYASNFPGKRILMLNAKEDEIIPKACTESLWRAFGEPTIIWYEGDHYSVVRHILEAMKRTQDFFAVSP